MPKTSERDKATNPSFRRQVIEPGDTKKRRKGFYCQKEKGERHEVR